MVFADWLAEQNDIRGELLVLEHALWAGDPKRTFQTADEIDDALWYADEIATEWLADRDISFDFTDFDSAELFVNLGRALLPLVSTPAPVRSLLSKRSHVLASLEPRHRREPVRPQSKALTALRDRLIAAVIAWISDAFDGVPVPDADHLTIHQAEAQDNYDRCDRSRDHVGRWQELPDQHLLANQWGLTHLDDQGVLYYFPAAMCFALRHLDRSHPDDSWLTESLEYNLQPSSAELRDHERGRLRLFSQPQRAAIHAFTVASGYIESAAAWSRVVAAEQDEDNPRWFDRYSPPPA